MSFTDFNNKIRLTSDMYVGQGIASISLDSKKGPGYDYTITKEELQGAGIEPIMPAEGLVIGSAQFGDKEANNIYGTWTIVYDNGCTQIEDSGDGLIADCIEDINPVLPSTAFYEGQTVDYVESTLQHNEDFQFNGFNELTGSNISLSDAGTVTPNFTIPSDNGTLPYENAGSINCNTFTITVAEAKNCTDIGAQILPQNQTVGSPVQVTGFDETIFTFVSVTPTNFAVGNVNYQVTFDVVDDEAYFFGLNGNTPILRKDCEVNANVSEFDCSDIQLELADIDLTNVTPSQFAAGISISDYLSITNDGGTGVELAANQPDWVLGENLTYTVNIDLNGTGLYNDAGVYEGTQTCTVTGTACKDDLDTGFVPVSQQQA